MTPERASEVLREACDAVGGGRVPLAWAVERDATGIDPVAAAWAACEDSWEMADLAAVIGYPSFWRDPEWDRHTDPVARTPGGSPVGCDPRVCAACLARVRLLVPRVTLEECVAAARARRG